jgi:hypothetical protein
VIVLVAKLWLVSYNRQTFSVGLPYDRAMKCQEAYNGVLVWNLGGGGGDKYVASHPAHCSLLVWVLCFVRYFISSPVKLNTNTSPSASVYAVQDNIGLAIEVLLSVGVIFLGFTVTVTVYISWWSIRFRSAPYFRVLYNLFSKSFRSKRTRIPCGSRVDTFHRKGFDGLGEIDLKGEQSDDVLNGLCGLPTSLSLVDDDMGGPIDEDPHLKNLEIYLARLSEFTDYEVSFWCLWKDVM